MARYPVLTIAIRDGERYYRARVSREWAQRHDNGALVSIGLTVGHDLTRASFARLFRLPDPPQEISRDQWNHDGCLSACIRRGAPACRW
jgi:hypothetical protein